MPTRHLFDHLIGQWTFHREISNQGTMSGTASFTLINPDRAAYEESGELKLNTGQTLHAQQHYFYQRTEAGFSVHFVPSGDLFLNLAFKPADEEGWNATAHHHCAPDLYNSEYRIFANEILHIRHDVTGPRKHHTIQTTYCRPQNS
jgi:hypothetical protein